MKNLDSGSATAGKAALLLAGKGKRGQCAKI